MNKQPSAVFWTTVVVVVVLVAYPVSFGPVCWWFHWRIEQPGPDLTEAQWVALVLYAPCGWAAYHGLPIIGQPLRWYASRKSADGRYSAVPLGWKAWGRQRL